MLWYRELPNPDFHFYFQFWETSGTPLIFHQFQTGAAFDDRHVFWGIIVIIVAEAG